MKKIILLVAIAIGFSGTAKADRWIVKNPHASLQNFSPLKVLEFGGDTYTVVNAPAYVVLAELNSYGDMAFPDARIVLPKELPAGDGLTASDTSDGKMAWHVKALEYENLPAKFNGNGIVVAVVDTGADFSHTALKDHAWTNTKEIPGNGIDDDHNGYIDDVHGWNFELNTADVMDLNGHGTHCAGIIAASPNPDNKAQGVAPGAKVMAIRVIGDKQAGFLSDAVAGIKYAVDNGANVLSNSWRVYKSWDAFDPSDENIALLKKAIMYAGDHGAVFVAASGNESLNMDTDFDRDPMFPGGYTGISNFIVVAASDEKGDPAYFTNFGATHVAVAAPGVSIISTIPGNGWTAMSGTSMSAPLVAGAVARGLSAHFAPAEITDRLVNSSPEAAGTWGSKIRAKGVINLMRYLNP
ncbi:MAG: S8 family peptidase [Bdellovibrionota bacterium]